MKDTDITSIISSVWSRSTFIPIPEHVNAHRDDLNRPLVLGEESNCRMNEKAKSIAWIHIELKRHLPSFPSSSLGLGTIICHGNLISSKFQRYLMYHIMYGKMTQNLSSNLDISSDILHKTVSWKCLGKARKKANGLMVLQLQGLS